MARRRTGCWAKSTRRRAAAWPPLALYEALPLGVRYDLSDVKLAEALDDRASFRRLCGFAARAPTPERTASVRLRAALVRRDGKKCR